MKYLALSIGGKDIPAAGGAPTGGTDILQNIIQFGISFSLIAAIVLALFVIIWGGIQWTTSGGDKQKLQQAKLRITFAIVGLIVALLAFFIIQILFSILLGPTGSGGGYGRYKF